MTSVPAPLLKAIKNASRDYGVPVSLLAAIWRHESGSTFPNPAVNSSGYGGLFGTQNWNGSTQEQADYAANILRRLLRQTNGNLPEALGIYSTGKPDGGAYYNALLGLGLKGGQYARGFGRGQIVSPVSKNATFERVDQGVDYSQSEPYVAMGDGTVYAIGSGFHGGTGQAVYIKLDHPITVNGRTYDEVYYAETTPLVKQGQKVKAGQAVASGGAAEIGFAQGARPMAGLGGGYGPATAASMQGHDFLDVVQNNPNVQIQVGGAPDISTVTASHHQQNGTTDTGLGSGFSDMPLEGDTGFGPQTSQNQEGASGLSPGFLSPFQASDIWQEIARQQNASPESRLLANNATQLTRNAPDLLANPTGT